MGERVGEGGFGVAPEREGLVLGARGRRERGGAATHQSGISVLNELLARSITGFLITAASNSSGNLAERCF